MKVLDYIVYIVYQFLLLIKKLNAEDFENRSKNIVTLIVFNITTIVFALIYTICISRNLIPYNGIVVSISIITLYTCVRYFVFKAYKPRLDAVIADFSKKYQYSKSKITIYFLLIWFIPIFLVFISAVFIRHFIYK